MRPSSEVRSYKELVETILASPAGVRLVAVDGHGGAGKSTFAERLVPGRGSTVGAKPCERSWHAPSHLPENVLVRAGLGCHAAGMAGTGDRYDVIGRSYTKTRREDPRVAAAIHAALGPSGSVLNVGAGSGNYVPRDRDVVAVEPSLRMLEQRHGRQALTVRGVAEDLPFPDESFDVAMAILTVHHWSNRVAGITEMARVSRRQVVFFFEPLETHDFWALAYFPAALDLPTERDPPGEQFFADHLEVREIHSVLVPHDCQDGFGTAFWGRPEAYLDPEVQAGMSWLAMLSETDRQDGARRLKADLDSGEWDRRYGQLRQQTAYDGGYRIAVAY